MNKHSIDREDEGDSSSSTVRRKAYRPTPANPMEEAIGRAIATPNHYKDFPEPIIVEMTGVTGWKYHRALCPEKFCRYEGLPHGFNQHYARMHAPDQWRQRAKRIIKLTAVGA